MCCCPQLQNLLANAGERGLAALIRDTPRGLRFRLQSRGISFSDEAKAPMPIPVDVNVSCSIGIRFCPFCGTSLAQAAAGAEAGLKRLSVDHAKYQEEEP